MERQYDVRTVARTATPPAAFVTLAYSWGREDGAAGIDRRGFLYWTLGDVRQAEYAAGYQAGAASARWGGER